MVVNVTFLLPGDRVLGVSEPFSNPACVQPQGTVKGIRLVPSRVWIDFTDGTSYPIHPSHTVVIK
jgi:hypothetical protein